MKYITKNLLVRICLFLLMSGQLSSAYADTELENRTLSRIRHVLNSLTPLINEAQQAQDKNTRMQFHYEWLRSDINQIKQGIDQKLNTPSIQPHTIQPIQGDYLTLKSQQK